jgi:hypothetical protein
LLWKTQGQSLAVLKVHIQMFGGFHQLSRRYGRAAGTPRRPHLLVAVGQYTDHKED